MTLKSMPFSLYSKIFLWLVLNLCCWLCLESGLAGMCSSAAAMGLCPAHLFSSNIENTFRLVSVNLQYRSVFSWQRLLKQNDRGDALRFHLLSLETAVLPTTAYPKR